MLNKIQESSLWVILDGEISSLEYMLNKVLDITNHQRNIQALITKLFKIMTNLAPTIMDLFTPRVNNPNL